MKVRYLDQYYDVIVIGAGASGIIASAEASRRCRKVLLLEKADSPGRKILASGNGRCNLMNSGKLRYYGDPEFAGHVLAHCTRDDLISFFRHYGLMLSEESDGRIYPLTFQSASVISSLKKAMELTGVHIQAGCAVSSVQRKNGRFIVQTEKGQTAESDKLIISCGGAAQPKLGGCCDGYRILKNMGHGMIPIKPSLVPLNTDSKSISGLSGIRFRCRVHLVRNHQTIHTENGEVLFTDYGISGICIMQCGRFADGNNSWIELDLLSNAFSDREQVIRELTERRERFADSSPVWLLNGILPDKLSYAVLKQSGVPLKGEKAGDTDDQMLLRIADTARGYRIEIKGTRGFDQAQVTSGGIDCSEFNPETMESRIVPGLYAAGEVLNIDGDCGGFNLMFAFASGMLAGRAV